jgi:hypothetical protein
MCCGLAPGRVGAVRTCPPESRDLDWSAVKPAGAAISALSLVPVTGTAAAVFSSGACAWPGTAWLDVVPDAPQPAIARASMTAGTVPALLARATSAGSFLTTHPRVAQQSTTSHPGYGSGRGKAGETGGSHLTPITGMFIAEARSARS